MGRKGKIMNILEQLQQNRWMIWAKEEEPLEEYPQVQLISICYRSDDCEVRGYAAAPKEAQLVFAGFF